MVRRVDGVKHNRDSNFHQASLDNAFDALTAFFIMLCAQYGWDFALTGDAAARAFFRLKAFPQLVALGILHTRIWQHAERAEV
ncbi:hypothetical protein ACVWXM_002521 [Bradyrhizobium sp. GM7.3]